MGAVLALAGLLHGTPQGAGAAGIPERTDPPAVLVRMAREASREPRVDLRSRGGAWQAIHAVQAPFEALQVQDPGLDADEPLRRTLRLTLEPGTDPVAVARRLAAEPGVEAAWVEKRYRVAWADAERFLGAASPAPAGSGHPPGAPAGSLDPDDPLFVDGSQWGLRNTGSGPFGGVPGMDIRAREGWAITGGSTSTPVAIVDTGCDLGQPELGGLLFDGSPRIVLAYNSSIEPYGASPWDSVGHGTLVAGVALARTNNGPQLDGRGVAGVAGGAGGDSAGCRVIVVKATPTHLLDALSTELAEGIIYAVTNGARAINLSFGGDDDDDTMLDAVSYAMRRGCTVVCGAGNGQDERPQYPGYYARYGNGVSVAALRPDGTLARFSTRGPQIDVAAPGENIYSAYLTYGNAFGGPLRDFAETGGTSFAAPFVTGLAGLVATLQPSVTDNEFQQLLRHTARDLGAPGRDDTYGWGVPDAGALLSFAAPPRGFLRGVVRAQSWTLLGEDSILIDKSRLSVDGCSVDGPHRAERWEVRARVDLPPGRLLETPLALARTHASNGWSAGPLLEYDLGYGEVVPGSASADGFTLRAFVYRVADPIAGCPQTSPLGFVPVRPESVTFGWSAFGRLDAPPTVRITAPAEDGAPWPVDGVDTLRWEASDPDEVSGFQVAVSSDGIGWRVAPGGDLGPAARQLALAAACPAGDSSFVRVLAFDAHGGVQDLAVARRALLPSRGCLPGEVADGRVDLLVLPNPAHGSVVFRYDLGGGSLDAVSPGPAGAVAAFPPDVRDLAIHDVTGRRIRQFPLDGIPSPLAWDGRDEGGRRLPSGVYLARLRAEGRVVTRRFVLFRD